MPARKAKQKTPRQMRSGYEKKVAAHLTSAKVPFEYETLKIGFTVPAKKRTYNPDFMLPNGIIVEAKGNLDRFAREKMALVIEQNPDLDIRLLFMRDNKITKQSKTKYSDWCTARGITYATSEQGHIPDSWLAEALATPSLDGGAGVQPTTAGRKGQGGNVRNGDGLDTPVQE